MARRSRARRSFLRRFIERRKNQLLFLLITLVMAYFIYIIINSELEHQRMLEEEKEACKEKLHELAFIREAFDRYTALQTKICAWCDCTTEDLTAVVELRTVVAKKLAEF